MIKTIVIDDDRKFLQRIKTFLSNDKTIEVVGEAYNGCDVVRLCKDLHPDIVIMDIRMPVMDGIKATKILKDEFSNIKVVILTEYFYLLCNDNCFT